MYQKEKLMLIMIISLIDKLKEQALQQANRLQENS